MSVFYEGYPLKVEYFWAPEQGIRLLEALKIMQAIGIDYVKASGMEKILKEKDTLPIEDEDA